MSFIKYFLLFSAIFASASEDLSVQEISLGNEILIVEIADSPHSRNEGLMFRPSLKDGHGMLFIFDKPHILSFWMKNTSIPLSIAFFDQNKVLLNISDMPPEQKGSPLPSFKSISPALYALEVPQGWFKSHKIEPGMKFSFRHP